MFGFPLAKPLRHCTPSELLRHADGVSAKASQSQRKYSLGLLDEAYKLYKEVGRSEAARISGVGIESLSKYIAVKKRLDGIPPRPSKSKMSNQQKQTCWEVASYLHARGFSGAKRKCWIEAGKRVGINGRSVEMQFDRGLWAPKTK